MDATDTLLIRDRGNTAAGDGHAETPDDEAVASEAKDEEQRAQDGSVPSADDFAHAGAMLAAARLAMDLDIKSVSERINVKPERLEAIETLNKADLPAPTFSLGFVRSYARTLGLPEDALVERFRRDAGYPEPRQTPVLEPKLQKDLSVSPQVSLFTVILLTCAGLWIVWQLLQAAAPADTTISAEAGAGIPLVERAQSTTGVVTQVTTSLSDEQKLGDALNLPSDMAPADNPVMVTSNEEVVLPITPEELELALAAGEEEARTASLENVRAAESDAAALLASNDADGASAEDGEDDTDMAGALEEDTAIEEATPVLSEADRLNAEALNRLALEEQAPDATSAPAEVEETSDAADVASVEPGVTDDGIEIVLGDANDIAEAETVTATPVVDGRTPATIRAAVEPVYPSRCESAASESETVTVRYTVSRYGKVVGPEIASTTNPCFNRAALAAISRWDFFPAEESGAAVGDTGRTSRVVFQRP